MSLAVQRKFILVSTQPANKSPMLLMDARHSLSLAHLKAGLKARGVPEENIYVLPDQADYKLAHFGNPEENPETKVLRTQLREVITDPENTVCCITLNTPHYFHAGQISHFFKTEFPGITVVVGGPHLRREEVYDKSGKRVRDAVELALSPLPPDDLGLAADAAIDGDMGPFLDFGTKHSGRVTDFNAPGFFHAKSIGRPVDKHDRGYYPQDLQAVPFVPFYSESPKPYESVLISLGGRCLNKCDFCCTNGGRLGFTEEAIAKTLEELHQREKLWEMYFGDPNPLTGRRFLSFLEGLGPKAGRMKKGVFLDPSLIATQGGMDLVARLVSYGVRGFFFGLDRDTEEMAKKIGSRLGGKLRNQAQLDAEREALKRMITKELPALAGNLAAPFKRFGVDISCIITPFETRESVLGMLDTMQDFKFMENEHVAVLPKLNLLAPYPGTELRRTLIAQGMVVDPEDFYSFGMRFCNWDPALGRSAQLIDEWVLCRSTLIQSERKPLVEIPDIGQIVFYPYQELVAKVFSGQVLPFSAGLKRSLLDQGFNL